MLVLSRRVDDAFVFPELGITVEVVEVKGRSTRLAIDAPRSIKILRRELLDRDPYPSDSLDCETLPPGSLSADKDSCSDALDIEQVQDQVGVARLALFLCQNQLKFDNHVFAQETLDYAIAAMDKLEAALAQHPNWKPCSDDQALEAEPSNDGAAMETGDGMGPVVSSAVVKEPAHGYQVRGQSPWFIEDESQVTSGIASPSNCEAAGCKS